MYLSPPAWKSSLVAFRLTTRTFTLFQNTTARFSSQSEKLCMQKRADFPKAQATEGEYQDCFQRRLDRLLTPPDIAAPRGQNGGSPGGLRHAASRRPSHAPAAHGSNSPAISAIQPTLASIPTLRHRRCSGASRQCPCNRASQHERLLRVLQQDGANLRSGRTGAQKPTP
jgi:hypothetical protein